MERLQELTRRYSRFQRNEAGLGHVAGGLLCLGSYFGGALLPWGLPLRLALAATPFLWLAVRGVLRARLYQGLGRVVEPLSAREASWHRLITGLLATGSVAVLVLLLWKLSARPQGAGLAVLPLAGYLGFVLAIPLVVWFWLWTVGEILVGVFLMCQAAVALVGLHYPLGSQLQAPLAAGIMVVAGAMQHARFRALKRELRAFSGGA
ncbi:MAG: hypothetical protein HZB25_05025 [Candidatus Eisenbacteria bacterium]|nr:hypothetical protein [Candidatus Eisenbacteria bacterium]